MSGSSKALAFGLSSLGFLVGNLIGLSSDSIAKSLIPLLFALGGGSSVVLLKGLSAEESTRATLGIGLLSLFCLAGTYLGIVITEHQLLTPQETRLSDSVGDTSVEGRKLLRSEVLDRMSSIDQRLRNRQTDCSTAYREVRELIEDELR